MLGGTLLPGPPYQQVIWCSGRRLSSQGQGWGLYWCVYSVCMSWGSYASVPGNIILPLLLVMSILVSLNSFFFFIPFILFLPLFLFFFLFNSLLLLFNSLTLFLILLFLQYVGLFIPLFLFFLRISFFSIPFVLLLHLCLYFNSFHSSSTNFPSHLCFFYILLFNSFSWSFILFISFIISPTLLPFFFLFPLFSPPQATFLTLFLPLHHFILFLSLLWHLMFTKILERQNNGKVSTYWWLYFILGVLNLPYLSCKLELARCSA